MTSIDPDVWTPIECSNGPHPLPTDGPRRSRTLHNIGGRWICHGCWTVGGITDVDEPEPC